MVRQWKLQIDEEKNVSIDKSCVRTWKSLPRMNPSPVSCMDGDKTSTLVAAGFAADGCVIVSLLFVDHLKFKHGAACEFFFSS